MEGKTLLIVDDDLDTCELLKIMFRRRGAEVLVATSGKEGLETFRRYAPDLVLLDIMMPGMDGLDVCSLIRCESRVPIVLVSVIKQKEKILEGLKIGADDYVTKPFDHDILQARVQAVLRRADLTAMQTSHYEDGYLAVDQVDQQVWIRGKPVQLSPTEYQLFSYLFQNACQVCSLSDILKNVWGDRYMDSPQYVHVYISRLRHKLEKCSENPEYIITEHRVGYRFVKKDSWPG